jgi:hypothetical protein
LLPAGTGLSLVLMSMNSENEKSPDIYRGLNIVLNKQQQQLTSLVQVLYATTNDYFVIAFSLCYKSALQK